MSVSLPRQQADSFSSLWFRLSLSLVSLAVAIFLFYESVYAGFSSGFSVRTLSRLPGVESTPVCPFLLLLLQ
jgi:ABC-type lipoprotein release transport system permease subunit